LSLVLLIDEILKSTMVEKLPSDLEGMGSSMEKLYVLIDEIYKYVDDAVVRIFRPKYALPISFGSRCHIFVSL
jgi:hypothetical protein